MSLPFPFPTTNTNHTNHINHINDDNNDDEEKLVSLKSIEQQYLNPDERWDIYCVKAAERPHLLSYIPPPRDTNRIHHSLDEQHHPQHPQQQEEEIDQEPLLDGCDIPGWRKECMELTINSSSDVYALFHIGSENAARYMKRSSQWPISPSYHYHHNYHHLPIDPNTRINELEDTIAGHTNNNSTWSQLRTKLLSPPNKTHDCKCVDYIYSCQEDTSYSKQIYIMSQPKTLTRTIFATQFEEPNIPAKIMHATDGWKAMPHNHHNTQSNGWEFSEFVKRFQTIKWRFSDVHGEMLEMGTYRKYIATEGSWDDSPLGIYDSEFGEDDATSMLLNEYSVPKCFSQDLFDILPDKEDTSNNNDNDSDSDNNDSASSSSSTIARPPYRWILIGPPRSGTGLHIDPLWTNAWVTLLQGTKRWMLFPPQTPPEQVGMIDGTPQIPSSIWFRDYYEKVMDDSTWPKEWKPVEVLQRPGETVFVPNGWMHLVLNLDLAVAVTHNYASEFGPFERMWQEVVSDEPAFALPWFQQMMTERPDLAARAYTHHRNHSDDDWTHHFEFPMSYRLQQCTTSNDKMEEKKIDGT